MKNIFLSIAILFSTLSLSAQDSPSRTEKTPADLAKMRSEHMKTQLNLTEDQKSKLYQIFLDEEKAKENEKITRKARAEKNQASIKKVLTPQQFKEFEQLREKRGDAREQRRPLGRRGNRTPADKKPAEK